MPPAQPIPLQSLCGVRPAEALPEWSAPGWSLEALAGRLVELTAATGAAVLTLASLLVYEAQESGEPVAWVTTLDQSFFPPDLASTGVNLQALPVVRVEEAKQLGRAASQLMRGGAFGLVVVDLCNTPVQHTLPIPTQTRLLGLTQKHDATCLFLTTKTKKVPSLSSLVSLRGQCCIQRRASDEFVCRLRAVKDKRHAPGWTHEVNCRGPLGLH